MHRTAAIFFLVACAALANAAEREVVTLRDGRVLTGRYDADAGTITLDGKGTAVVKVGADAIANREAAPPEVQAAAKPAIAPAQAPKPAARPSAADTLTKAYADIDRIRHDAADAEAKVIAAWIHDADLHELPVPDVGADPRQSDRDRRSAVERVNAFVRRVQARAHAGAWGDIGHEVETWVRQGNMSLLTDYDRLRQ